MVISATGMYRLLLTWCTCLMEHLRLIKILILGMYQMWGVGMLLGNMFRLEVSFNQDISDWNVSSFGGLMRLMFEGSTNLSDFNKGKIHEAFSSNPNWLYDWREFVVLDHDSNFQTAVNLWFDNQAKPTPPTAILAIGMFLR